MASTGLDLLLVSFVCIVTSSCASVFNNDEELKLEKYIDSFLGCRDVPGLGIAVVKDGESFSKGYGMADVENRLPADSSTIFCVGSVTKSMTAMLLAKMISKREYKLSWTSKVKDVLGPEYTFNKDCITDYVTIADILSHRTGLTSADLLLQAGIPTTVTREHQMKNLHYLPSLYEFRDTFYYNNLVYVLAAHMAEKRSQKSWEQLMKDELFKPLNMNSTVLLDTNYPQSLAVPYIIGKNGTLKVSDQRLYSIHPFGPAGSVCSSADDMIKWLNLITSEGKNKSGGSLILDFILKKQFEPVSTLHVLWAMAYSLQPTFPEKYDTFAYGYGWFASYYRGHKLLHHAGSLYGYSCKIAYLPEIKSAFIFFNNGPGELKFEESIDPIFYFLLDIVIGYTPWLNETTACTYPEPWRSGQHGRKRRQTERSTNNFQTRIENIERYVGVYSNPLYGEVTFRTEEDILYIEYGVLLNGTVTSTFSVELDAPLDEVLFNSVHLTFNDLGPDNKYQSVNMVSGIEKYSFTRVGDDTNNSNRLIWSFALFVPILITIVYLS